MSTGTLGQGLGTIAAGGVVAYLSWVVSRSRAFVNRTADALIRARLRAEQDRETLTRGVRIAGVFGIGMGAVLMVIGAVTLIVT